MFEPASSSVRDRHARRKQLEERMAALQADINAANARLASLVEEHSRYEDWRVHEGIRSESSFLSWRLGLTPTTANSVVAVSEGLRTYPRIAAAFRAGRLSLDQVRAVVQVVTPEDESELPRLALGMSGSQLASFCAYYRRILRLENGRHRARFLRSSYTADAMWRISGLLPAEEGAVVDQAITAVIARLRAETDSAQQPVTDEPDQPPPDQPEVDRPDPAGSPEPADTDALEAAEDPFAAERADALIRLASSFLQGDRDEGQPEDRYQVVIHADLAALAAGEGDARIEGGGEIPVQAAARIACESSIVGLVERNGKALSVGRKTRRVGRGLRRALEARDRRCCFPGCHRRGRLQAHHIKYWTDGGETSPDNLLMLCRSHHIATHEGDLTVERTLAGFLFRRADGSVIRRATLRAAGPGIGHDNRARGIDVTPETCAPEWGGERGSILYVAEVFASRSPPA